jgi:protein-tyrosine phosphatase
MTSIEKKKNIKWNKSKKTCIIEMKQIINCLYLGSYHDASDYVKLKNNNIKFILNVAEELTNKFPQEFTYYKIHLADDFKQNILSYLDELTNYIHKIISNNDNILVHCHMGISRSPAIIVAYLIKYQNMIYSNAFNFVKLIKPNIDINQNFVKQLKLYSWLNFKLTLQNQNNISDNDLKLINNDLYVIKKENEIENKKEILNQNQSNNVDHNLDDNVDVDVDVDVDINANANADIEDDIEDDIDIHRYNFIQHIKNSLDHNDNKYVFIIDDCPYAMPDDCQHWYLFLHDSICDNLTFIIEIFDKEIAPNTDYVYWRNSIQAQRIPEIYCYDVVIYNN